MRIKKLLIVACCVALTGCGSKDNGSSSKSSHYITPTAVVEITNTPSISAEATQPSVAPTEEVKPVVTEAIEPSVIPTEVIEPSAYPTEVITPTAIPTEAPVIINPGGKETYSLDSSWEYANYAKISSGSVTLYRTSVPNPKNKIICVNAGHGTQGGASYSVQCHPDGSPKIVSGSTSAGQTTATAIAYGTVMQDGTSEATATKKLAIVLKDVLLDSGYDVLMIRESDDVALDNIARTVMANNLADCHIAIHYDSTSSDKGAFYMSVPNVESYKNMYPVSKTWQENNRLGDSIISAFKENGLKIFSYGSMEMDLVQMSYSTIPNIDLEVGDTASDCSKEALEKLARGILKGLDIFYN